MVDVNSTFGFEVFQSLYDSQISKKEDVLILFVHWYFIKNSFRCIGLGDSKAYNETEKGSELLPAEWSKESYYALRYVKDKKLYILHGIKSDEDLLLNLLRTGDQRVSNIQFEINQTVTDLRGPLESLIPSYQTVIQVIQTDLLNPIMSDNAANTTANTSTQTSTESRDSNIGIPLRQGLPIRARPGAPHAGNIGERDLNPLAREGGGMIFDPFPLRDGLAGRPGLGVPGRLPPGAVPPYARFDPFGPPDVNLPRPRPRDPDADHLPPPGYDDMFM
ncbi:proteasome inhibitor 31 kDa [Megalopta genalis]|uniref:proteasome inhibitor 31 kDa n=1 Tax=Megalopta genalis TaxID=115081 RepID=UPI0014430DBE|nr:proteasome inhibitor PI31 subunit-like [Megalopta genalis]